MAEVRADERTAKAREQRIREIAERDKKATPGEWTVGVDSCAKCREQGKEGEYEILEVPSGYHAMLERKEDAEFIAHARMDIPFLLEALASERSSAIKEAREECARMADQIAQDCSACSYAKEKDGKEPSFCENFGCSNFSELAAAIRALGER